MNIETLIAQYAAKVDAARLKNERARQAIKSILDQAEKAGHNALSAAEDRQCESLLAEADQAKRELADAESALAKAQAIKAEDDEYVRQSSISHPAIAARGRGQTSVISAASGRQESADEAPQWIRNSDGRQATVNRGDAFASHEVVREQIARDRDRDAAIIGAHGNFGSYLRSMTTTGTSAIVPTVWSSEVIDKARNAAVVSRPARRRCLWMLRRCRLDALLVILRLASRLRVAR